MLNITALRPSVLPAHRAFSHFAFSVILCCRLADVKLNLSIRAFVRLHVWWLMMLELANVKTNIMNVCVGAMSSSLVVFHYDFE